MVGSHLLCIIVRHGPITANAEGLSCEMQFQHLHKAGLRIRFESPAQTLQKYLLLACVQMMIRVRDLKTLSVSLVLL
jgi:hypothetical protein